MKFIQVDDWYLESGNLILSRSGEELINIPTKKGIHAELVEEDKIYLFRGDLDKPLKIQFQDYSVPEGPKRLYEAFKFDRDLS